MSPRNLIEAGSRVIVSSPKLDVLANVSLGPVQHQRLRNAFRYEVQRELEGLLTFPNVDSPVSKGFAITAIVPKAVRPPLAVVKAAVSRALVKLHNDQVGQKLPSPFLPEGSPAARGAREVDRAAYLAIEVQDDEGNLLFQSRSQGIEEMEMLQRQAPARLLSGRDSNGASNPSVIDLERSFAPPASGGLV